MNLTKLKLFNEKNFMYLLFGSIYFVQGGVLAYFQTINKTYLESNDVDLKIIGIISGILLIPFLLKIFVGIVSDHYPIFGMGKRKPYIIMGLIMGSASFYLASIFPPDSELFYFTFAIVFGSFSITLFDSSTDGLAIDSTTINEHGRVQGIMVGFRSLSFILLSLIFQNISIESNFNQIFWIISISMLFPLIILIWYKPKSITLKKEKFQWSAFSSMRSPIFIIFAIYAILYSIISFGIDGTIPYFINQEYQPTEDDGMNFNIIRAIGAMVGAFMGGFLIDRYGHKKSSLFALFMLSTGAILLSFSWNLNSLFVIGVLWGIVWGFQETVFFSLAMDIADARIAASMFAIIMAISNLGTASSEVIFIRLAENLNYRNIYQLSALLNILTFCILFAFFYVQKTKTKK